MNEDRKMNRENGHSKPIKKRYYLPGWISLILLPVTCIWYFHEHKVFRKQRVLELVWSGETTLRKQLFDIPFDIHPERNFLEINLDTNSKDNAAKLQQAQIAIRELVATQDTVKGVRFHFADHVKYQLLIRAVDICRIEKARIYVPNKNDLWVFNYHFNPKPSDPPPCGGCIRIQPPEDQKEVEKINWSENFSKYSVSGCLFLWLTIISLRKLRNR